MVVVVVWLVGDLKVLKTTTLIASEAGYNRYRAATIAVLLLLSCYLAWMGWQ